MIDEFAKAALMGMLMGKRPINTIGQRRRIAQTAYEIAKEMMIERDRIRASFRDAQTYAATATLELLERKLA